MEPSDNNVTKKPVTEDQKNAITKLTLQVIYYLFAMEEGATFVHPAAYEQWRERARIQYRQNPRFHRDVDVMVEAARLFGREFYRAELKELEELKRSHHDAKVHVTERRESPATSGDPEPAKTV